MKTEDLRSAINWIEKVGKDAPEALKSTLKAQHDKFSRAVERQAATEALEAKRVVLRAELKKLSAEIQAKKDEEKARRDADLQAKAVKAKAAKAKVKAA